MASLEPVRRPHFRVGGGRRDQSWRFRTRTIARSGEQGGGRRINPITEKGCMKKVGGRWGIWNHLEERGKFGYFRGVENSLPEPVL